MAFFPIIPQISQSLSLFRVSYIVKQQYLGLILLVSLGIGGVVLSHPKVISFGAALLGIRSSSEAIEPSSDDEGEFETSLFSPVVSPQYAALELVDHFSDSWETLVPVYPDHDYSDHVYPDHSINLAYETSSREIESGSDYAFADLSVPLSAEITTVAAVVSADSPGFGEVEVVPLTAEPLEEIVLYEAPPRLQSEPQNASNTNLPVQPPIRRRVIAAPPGSYPVSPTPARNPLASEASLPSVPDIGAQQRFHVEANLVEVVPLPGAETVARVGTEIILGCDILPDARKIAYLDIQETLKNLPPEERQKVTDQEIQARQEAIIQQVFPMLLNEYVRFTLLYCDFASGRKKEEIQMWEKRVGDSFEEHELPKLMKQFGATNRMELNTTLEQLIGSSIEREKALFVRKMVGDIMIRNTIKEAEGECTHEEMLNYYNEHKPDFFHRARARWFQMTVNVTPSLPRERAREKMVWMGNQVAAGVPFEQVARDHSDGFTAGNGGFSDWVSKGSLVSDALEQAVFQGPIRTLSPIIEDRNAFHIVRVLDREEEYYTPFPQAQSEIKKKIKELRRNKKEAEYYAELTRKFQPETYQNNVTNFSLPGAKIALPQGIGTSLHAR